MNESMSKFNEFCEANPETSAEAFMISKGDFKIYCKIMDFGMNVFMRTEIAAMDREISNIQAMNEDLDDLINLHPSEEECKMFNAEHDMEIYEKVNGLDDVKDDKPYEFAAMKETAEELESKRKIDEHPISKLFTELFGRNMGIWL